MEENNKGPCIGLSDTERFPLLNDINLLHELRQDEWAPNFNFMSGDRITAHHLQEVEQYALSIRTARRFWNENQQPDWLERYWKSCTAEVPFYKYRSGDFRSQPCITREDIRRQPWLFVSEKAKLNDLLVYQTSGTTGAPLDVLFDPVSQACWLPQMQSVLDEYGVFIGEQGRKVAIALICSQATTLTYASLSTYLNGAGILKLNLNTAEWKYPSHPVKYLEKYNPEILTGDPFAFMALLQLKPEISPKALISSAMKLNDGIRKELEGYFNTPVLDVYSLTECRNIAVFEGNKYRAIRPELYLEVFHPEKDEPLPCGERGELVVSGGNNPFLPLIRYRTGDFCCLKIEDGVPYLEELEARKLTIFYSLEGALVNTIDISRKMTRYPLSGFRLHQSENLSLQFEAWTNEDVCGQISSDLLGIFGQVQISIKLNSAESGLSEKVVTYTSDFSNNSDSR